MKPKGIFQIQKDKFKRLIIFLPGLLFPIVLGLAYFQQITALYLLLMVIGVAIFMRMFIGANKGKISASKRGRSYEVLGPEAKKMGYFLSAILLIVMISLLVQSYLSL